MYVQKSIKYLDASTFGIQYSPLKYYNLPLEHIPMFCDPLYL